MTLVAARIIVRRSPDAPRGILTSSFFSMALTGLIVTFSVTGLIVHVEPWYRAQYVIPIAGMVLGNSMTGIALALERVFADMDARADELLALTALGATPWESAAGSIRTALRAGMIPTINSMAAVGIVFIPGMMTGTDPRRRRSARGDGLPDRRHAHGRRGDGDGFGAGGAAHVSASLLG